MRVSMHDSQASRLRRRTEVCMRVGRSCQQPGRVCGSVYTSDGWSPIHIRRWELGESADWVGRSTAHVSSRARSRGVSGAEAASLPPPSSASRARAYSAAPGAKDAHAPLAVSKGDVQPYPAAQP